MGCVSSAGEDRKWRCGLEHINSSSDTVCGAVQIPGNINIKRTESLETISVRKAKDYSGSRALKGSQGDFIVLSRSTMQLNRKARLGTVLQP
jgi:hypothetical protein